MKTFEERLEYANNLLANTQNEIDSLCRLRSLDIKESELSAFIAYIEQRDESIEDVTADDVKLFKEKYVGAFIDSNTLRSDYYAFGMFLFQEAFSIKDSLDFFKYINFEDMGKDASTIKGGYYSYAGYFFLI